MTVLRPGHNPPHVTMHAFTSSALKYICKYLKKDSKKKLNLQQNTSSNMSHGYETLAHYSTHPELKVYHQTLNSPQAS
jgi:hypothetical protein